jgi:tripartite-type tricarboxylate transporter receptor subunit TctC
MKRIILGSLLALGLMPAMAQDSFPSKPVTLVVATPAGGVTDKVMRVVARALQTQWNQSVLIDNRPGAAGNIASQHVAKATPDGYTLLVSAGPFAINPALFKSLPFDTRKDFAPIGLVGSFSTVLLVHNSFPAKTYAEFANLAKNPSQPVSIASPGNGTAQHLAMELLRSSAKLSLNHVPYKGGAPAINDLLAGHVQVMMSGMGDASPQLASGRIRPLAITGKQRSSLLPNVPTFTELGVMDFDASGWMGLHAPAGTPVALLTKINRDLATALADPAVRQAMNAMEVDPRPLSLPDFRQYMDTQFAKWKEAVDLSGAKVD